VVCLARAACVRHNIMLILCRWHAAERAGPGPSDGSSVVWLYHSHLEEPADTYAGMLGAIVVTARGMADAQGKPSDVDQELFTFWSVMNEGGSRLFDKNDLPTPVPVAQEADFEESNLMHSINGYVYGNMPELTVNVGSRTRWYTFALGTEVDLHTAHWHGQVVLANGKRSDVVELLPASMVVADMVPDNPGKWMLHCHVNDHIDAGMIEMVTVKPATGAQASRETVTESSSTGTFRFYAIAPMFALFVYLLFP
jgi:manganese oxidase